MRFLLGLLFCALSFSSFGGTSTTVDSGCVKYAVTLESKADKEKVEKKILALNGVTIVHVYVDESYIEVTFTKAKVTAEAIKAKIAKLGLNPQPLKCNPQSSYCEGDCSSCSAIRTKGRH